MRFCYERILVPKKWSLCTTLPEGDLADHVDEKVLVRRAVTLDGHPDYVQDERVGK